MHHETPAQVAERRAYIAHEAEWMLDAGEWPPRVARRLGYSSAKTLDRVLREWGHERIARRLDPYTTEKKVA